MPSSFFTCLFCFCRIKKTKKEKLIASAYPKHNTEVVLPSKILPLNCMSPQEFCLPKPVINYLIKNAKVENIKKLQQTCCYFLSKFCYSIIDSLSIASYLKEKEIFTYNLLIPDAQIEHIKNNIYLSQYLYLSSNSLEKFYSKIIKCEISELRLLCNKNFTINNFAFLAKSGTLKIVEIYCNIFYEDGTLSSLEDILSYIPNVYSFSHEKCIFTSKTMTNLFSLKRNIKFRYFHLIIKSEFPDVHLFNKYIKEMFDFNYLDSTNYGYLSLTGRRNSMQQLFELVKLWRQHSFLDDHGGENLPLYIKALRK